MMPFKSSPLLATMPHAMRAPIGSDIPERVARKKPLRWVWGVLSRGQKLFYEWVPVDNRLGSWQVTRAATYVPSLPATSTSRHAQNDTGKELE